MTTKRKRTFSQKSELIYDLHNFGILIDTREIFIVPNQGRTSEDAYIDHSVAAQFLYNLQILNYENSDPILVHISTCGGDWNYGIAIYDAIKNSCDDENLSDVFVLSHAHARSMSSIIPHGAKKRYIMPNADYLVHFGTLSIGQDNYTNVISEAKWCEFTTEQMIKIYVDRIYTAPFFKRKKMKKSAVKEWLVSEIKEKQEFYMTPEESLDKGFVDGIIGKNNLKISDLRK